ncbi:hypothetical protein EQG63_03805 [Flavobacterium amnicola]|uniref:Uncharacterized protein n=1 Tax=Flavobacterium amnicola TaxID=2506422 RepID=A0A4Q1K745_9FLAO|nr:hypothetical protein [Flavobacterium amnicola]RXR21074.1 hypothetical protein EQG63_03805 [Flavobacterium amnicola]
MKKILYISFLIFTCGVFSQVGIGTANPQKELHVAGTTSTIRIEKLDAVNSPTLNDGVKLAPVYVTENGDLTLTPPNYTTAGPPAVPGAPLNFLITLQNFIPDGALGYGVVLNNGLGVTNASGLIQTVPFTAPQSALIEVKYGVTVLLSDVDINVGPSAFADISARNFKVYFHIDLNNDGLDAAELSKKYGVKGQSYASFNQGIIGYPYMNSHGYANIPAGNHSLKFFAETNDGTNLYTSAGFGGAQDFLKIRIFN